MFFQIFIDNGANWTTKSIGHASTFYHLKKLVKTANKDKDKTVVLKCILTRKVQKRKTSPVVAVLGDCTEKLKKTDTEAPWHIFLIVRFNMFIKSSHYYYYPPASKASREVANLTRRKNPHTPIYDVEEFVCLSVCNEF